MRGYDDLGCANAGLAVRPEGHIYSHSLMCRRVVLPTHELVPQDSKLRTRKWLGEDVSELFLGGDVLDVDQFHLDVASKVVEVNREVLCARA